jgi:hypothetical protein
MLVINTDINTRCVNGKEVVIIVVFVVVVVIIICHELGLERPVVASSISLFKGLLRHIRPFGLNSALFLAPCCLFLLCHSQFHLYFLSFLSTGYNFNFSKISSFLLWPERVLLPVLLKNFILSDVNYFLSLVLGVQIFLPYKRMGTANLLYTFILDDLWTKVCLTVWFRIYSV